MKVYHFLPAKWGLQDLERRRVKISRLDELNDPFELVSADYSNRNHRPIWRSWREEQVRKWGLICFSRSWRNPVLWSHYADRHRGMCLGFEIPDRALIQVRYTKNRLKLDIEKLFEKKKLKASHMTKIFSTKFLGWSYEQEARVYAKLDEMDQETGLYFHGFGEQMSLTEIIAGPLCEVSKDEITAHIQPEDASATVIKSRLAFQTFSVVEQK